MWVKFVVGSLLCSERFFSGYSGFPLSSKTNISKFQFGRDYCQALYHESLARVTAQALPVFEIKFAFLHFFFPVGLENKFPMKKFPLSKCTSVGISKVVDCVEVRKECKDASYTQCSRVVACLKERDVF